MLLLIAVVFENNRFSSYLQLSYLVGGKKDPYDTLHSFAYCITTGTICHIDYVTFIIFSYFIINYYTVYTYAIYIRLIKLEKVYYTL